MSSPLEAITWNTSQPDLSVTYNFYEAGTEIESEGSTITALAPTAFFQSQAKALFETISNVTNLTFTAQTGAADLRFMLTDDLDEGTDGYMNPPEEENAGLGVFKNAVDDKFETGAYNYMVIVHELMHGLGLSHPHDDGGASTIMDGVIESFDDFGDFNLNQGVFTVMTYNNGYPLGTVAPESGLFGYEVGPMALDIAVLQEKYGANLNYATGDDTYLLDGDNGAGTGWVAIWDAGGNDIVEYGGELDVTIDLRAATLEYGEGGGGYVSSADGIAGGFTIANGVVIENASGGKGADSLRGNTADNVLRGSGGADTLKGDAGNDSMFGGAGSDLLGGGAGADTLNGYNGADVLNGGAGNDFLGGGKGADTLNSGSGDDILGGGKGADALNGGAGNDILKGSKGADVLNGGDGADIMNGGKGADVFVFTSVDMGDMINDFNSGQDHIDLTALNASVEIEEQDDGNFAILLDLNDDGQYDDGLILSVQDVTYTDISM